MAGNSSGGAGFFIDSPWASASSAQGASSSRAATSASVRRLASSSQHEALVPLTLTSKQEQRLMSYIDDALLFLSRGYAKRYEPNSSTALASLTAYIEQVDQLLRIVTQIPPHGSALSLLTSYLLRITGDVVDHVPNYRLAVGFDDKHPMVEHKEQNPTQTRFAAILEELRASLVLLDLLDRAWNAILCGEQVVYEQAKSNAEQAIDAVAGGGKWRRKRRREDVDQEEKGAQQTHDQGVLVGEEEEETLETITSRRYHQSALDRAITATGRSGARDMAHPIQRDSAPILGTKGIRTVPQTDRVRLRNAIVLGKENLFIWMREAVNAPPPPRVIDEVTGRRLDLDLPRTESNGTEVQRQRLRELLVDQGNLNEDLSARHEVLKDEVDGADADAGAAAASRLDEAEQKEYNDALLAEEQEENLELEEVLPHREAPVPPVNDDEADKGGREEQEQEDGIEPTTEEGRHFKDLFDRKVRMVSTSCPRLVRTLTLWSFPFVIFSAGSGCVRRRLGQRAPRGATRRIYRSTRPTQDGRSSGFAFPLYVFLCCRSQRSATAAAKTAP